MKRMIAIIAFLIGLFIISQLAKAGTKEEWQAIANKYTGCKTITKVLKVQGKPVGYIIMIFPKNAKPTDTVIAADIRDLYNRPIYFYEKKNGKMTKVWESPTKKPKGGKSIEA